MSYPRFFLPAAFFATALAANTAGAQSLAIEPVTVQLSPGQMAATLTVANQSGAETSFQVRAFGWEEGDAEDKLTPTDRIVLSPPLGTIAPNGRQLIRLVLQKPAQDHEETYRIWLDQIPAATEPGTVRIALRLSIPVFAQPATRTAPQLAWSVARRDGKLVLTAVNSGTRHQAVRDIALTAGAMVLKPEKSISPYVLAGAARSWSFAAPAALPATLRLTATTDDGVLDQAVTPDAGAR